MGVLEPILINKTSIIMAIVNTGFVAYPKVHSLKRTLQIQNLAFRLKR